jgi:hypothetical protein
VLERVTILALGGKGALDFAAGGVVWTCEIDQRFIIDDDAGSGHERDTASNAA